MKIKIKFLLQKYKKTFLKIKSLRKKLGESSLLCVSPGKREAHYLGESAIPEPVSRIFVRSFVEYLWNKLAGLRITRMRANQLIHGDLLFGEMQEMSENKRDPILCK